MIRRLHRRFILINMTLVALVLLIVFTVLCLSVYDSEKQANLAVLEQALMQPPPALSGEPSPDRFDGFSSNRFDGFAPRERVERRKPCVILLLAADGTVSSVSGENISFLSEQEILLAVNTLIERGVLPLTEAEISSGASGEPAASEPSDPPASSRDVKTTAPPLCAEGILNSLGLRYAIRRVNGQTLVALTDRSNEQVSLRNLFFASLAAGGASLAAFFAISVFLSSLALRPAEKAWKQQKQFTADASHELKTPLTVILANLGILAAHPQETLSSQSQWLESTLTEALRMKKLVDDLLYLARSDDREQALPLCRISVSDVIQSAVLPFESVAFEHGLTLDSRIAPDLFLTGDAGQLERLTAILLDNACKYAAAGTSVTVSLTRDKGRCLLRVSNQGPVIPAADREHVFERFYRSDASRTRTAGGYGLGLAIAHSIVSLHRGSIQVEQSDETKTIFCVSLPM